MDEHRGPVCSRPDCACGEPGPVCDEFMGAPDPHDEDDPDGRWCPRCGWTEFAHLGARQLLMAAALTTDAWKNAIGPKDGGS